MHNNSQYDLKAGQEWVTDTNWRITDEMLKNNSTQWMDNGSGSLRGWSCDYYFFFLFRAEALVCVIKNLLYVIIKIILEGILFLLNVLLPCGYNYTQHVSSISSSIHLTNSFPDLKKRIIKETKTLNFKKKKISKIS